MQSMLIMIKRILSRVWCKAFYLPVPRPHPQKVLTENLWHDIGVQLSICVSVNIHPSLHPGIGVHYSQMSQLMRLWYFLSSVNCSNAHVQPSSGARCLIFGLTLHLLPYLMCVNSEGSGESVWMRRLAWAFAGRLCDKYRNLMSWLIS